MGRATEAHLISLDLGTSTTRCAVVCCRPNGDLVLEGYAETPTLGVVKGLTVDAAQAAASVSAALDGAGTRARVRILSVLVAAATPYARGFNSRGCIGIAHDDKVVRGPDARRALLAANRISLPSDRGVVEVYSQGFAVDDVRGIHNPVGIAGGRLEAEVHVVTDSLSVIPPSDSVRVFRTATTPRLVTALATAMSPIATNATARRRWTRRACNPSTTGLSR